MSDLDVINETPCSCTLSKPELRLVLLVGFDAITCKVLRVVFNDWNERLIGRVLILKRALHEAVAGLEIILFSKSYLVIFFNKVAFSKNVYLRP